MLPSTLSSAEPLQFSRKTGMPESKLLWMWIFSLVTIGIIYLSTLDVAPYLHSDEFMTLDLGRIILHPDTDWSIAWLTDKDQPVFSVSYIGPVLQELIYEIAGQYGPRISALLGALFAATVMRGWLIARGSSQKVAFLLGLVFLLDPLFVQAYTMGRVDGWTIAFCLTSCWIIRDTNNNLPEGGISKSKIIIAGAFVILALFTWPSAIFLLPLVFQEMIGLINKCRSVHLDRKTIFLPAIYFVTGCFIAGVLLLAPIAPYLYLQWSNVLEGIAANTHSGPSSHSLNFSNVISAFKELLSVLKFTPVLLVLALIGIIKKRDIGLMVSAIVTIILMVFTMVYIQRVQYLLPYLIISAAGLFYVRNELKGKQISSLLNRLGLSILLIWAFGLSLIIRTILALDDKADRNRDLIYHAARSMVGSGNHAVFAPYEFYYAARSLNWKMYGPYIPRNDSFSLKILQKILPHVDFVIIHSSSELSPEFAKELSSEGIYDKGTYNIYNEPPEEFDGKTTNIIRMRNLYSIFKQPYGPYKIYVREANHIMAKKGP